MLLSPRSGAETLLKRIRIALEWYNYYVCSLDCTLNGHKELSYYQSALCHSGASMELCTNLWEPALEDEDGGVFVKGLTRYIISDELEIVPLSPAASISLLFKQGEANGSTIEERIFGIGKIEILNLLKNMFISKKPLTETLLSISTVVESNQEDFYQRTAAKRRKIEPSSIRDGTIIVKLFLSKTKGVVCYAEADEDFVDLLFGFLTIPLGNILKEMHGIVSTFEGCAHHLHESVQKLDATNYLMSDEIKQLLLRPKVAAHFGLHKQLLGVQEVSKHYFGTSRGFGHLLSTDKSLLKCPDIGYGVQELKLLDPKASCKNKASVSSGGYVKTPMTFTITDDLVITTSSPHSGFVILNKLKVPFNDIEERTVNVGKEQATSLLVASLISKSPLTDVFIRKVA